MRLFLGTVDVLFFVGGSARFRSLSIVANFYIGQYGFTSRRRYKCL